MNRRFRLSVRLYLSTSSKDVLDFSELASSDFLEYADEAQISSVLLRLCRIRGAKYTGHR